MADTGDLGEYGQNPFDFMSPQDMVAAALGSNAVINGGADASPAASPSLAPSAPMRGMVPAAAMTRPAMSSGANLDMGAPAAPPVPAAPAAGAPTAVAPTSPLQPVLRVASQPSIPMPQAPALDPQRAVLQQQAAGLRQPLDPNSPQFRPHWYDYLKAAALGALGGVGHRPDLSAAAGDKAVHGKYDDAEAARKGKLAAAEGSISDIDKAQEGKDKEFGQEMDVYKGAIGQRREDRAEESQSRRDAAEEQRNTNEDRRLTSVEQSEKDRAAKDAATEKATEAREAETARHNKADEGLKKQANDIADRNASTRESNSVRYTGVSDKNKALVDRVYADRDKRIDALGKDQSRAKAGLAFLPDGPTKQKQQQAIDADYQKRVSDIHSSAKQRITQLGGKYDDSLDGGGSNSGGKYQKGDQVKGGKYDGYYVVGNDAKGNYQLSKSNPAQASGGPPRNPSNPGQNEPGSSKERTKAPSGSGYPTPAVPGNIQWYGRPSVPMPGGRNGTVYSASREENGKEVLFPTIYGGKVHSEDEAWQHYKQTGEHMGKFKSVADADAYAQKYHEDAAAGKYDKAPR